MTIAPPPYSLLLYCFFIASFFPSALRGLELAVIPSAYSKFMPENQKRQPSTQRTKKKTKNDEKTKRYDCDSCRQLI
jgi:hypothetical protein